MPAPKRECRRTASVARIRSPLPTSTASSSWRAGTSRAGPSASRMTRSMPGRGSSRSPQPTRDTSHLRRSENETSGATRHRGRGRFLWTPYLHALPAVEALCVPHWSQPLQTCLPACTSKASRTTKWPKTLSRDGIGTLVPARGRLSNRPSHSSLRRASEMGRKLIPNSAASFRARGTARVLPHPE